MDHRLLSHAFDPDEQLKSQSASIIAAIERISTAFRAGLWEESKQLNLSPLQSQILIFVAFHTSFESTISSLAKEFAVTKATISDAVKTLLGKKMLEKTESKDARGYQVLTTVAGKENLEKLLGISKFFGSALARSSKIEKEKILEGLILLTNNLQKTGIISTRMCYSCKYYSDLKKGDFLSYCHLLKKPLKLQNIRIDCKEHALR